MPDIRAAGRLARDLGRVEQALAKATREDRDQARLEMLDAMVGQGIEGSGLARELERLVEQLGQAIGRAGRDQSGALVLASERAATSQLQARRRFRPETPRLGTLRDPGRERGALDDLERGLPQWQLSSRAVLTAEAGRLARGGEDAERAARLLFSTRPVGGRASAWMRIQNDFDLALQLVVFGIGHKLLNLWFRRGQASSGERWYKQCIAAIDERTTECCLLAHGQIRALDQPFVLSGTPRFADRVKNPPFHWYCRTAETLYSEEMETEGVSSEEMRAAARAELEARADGSREVIHPAHAASKRAR